MELPPFLVAFNRARFSSFNRYCCGVKYATFTIGACHKVDTVETDDKTEDTTGTKEAVTTL
jgi:hypothetical protein